ncbi:hypothetical protein ACFYUY_27565 [Kitasatospora sp. NPDC004745]|uniref:hypothetical protein n=1 Tax=Kitasatospora sp. NPDC004745 TaxID=3364019 RepID=UPI00367CE752
MLGLLGFHDELEGRAGAPNGSVHDAVRAAGEPDEAALVGYLDAGHPLIDVTEGRSDVITGAAHRHSGGSSSLLTDGEWLWRLDLAHYVETHHLELPGAFLGHVRALAHRMPALDWADLAPRLDAALPLVGWTSAVPWPLTRGVREPEPSEVMTRAEFEAREAARARERPGPRRGRARKPRWA